MPEVVEEVVAEVVGLVDWLIEPSSDLYSGVPSWCTVIVGKEPPFQPEGGSIMAGGYIPGSRLIAIPQRLHPPPQKS